MGKKIYIYKKKGNWKNSKNEKLEMKKLLAKIEKSEKMSRFRYIEKNKENTSTRMFSGRQFCDVIRSISIIHISQSYITQK